MAGTAAQIVLLTMMVVGVCLDVCMACGECGGVPSVPVVPVHKPPRTPKPPKPPKSPKSPKAPKAPTSPSSRTCPVDVIKLGVCGPLLGGVVGALIPASTDCCALLDLLGVDLEICLCLALDANVLGIIIHAKVDAVATILTSCGLRVPPKFSCPR